MNKRYLIVLSCCLLLMPIFSFAAEKSCTSCHEKVKKQSLRGRYVHLPFLREQCTQCHVAGTRVSAPIKKSALAVEKEQVEKIRWFQTASSREQEHRLRLSAEQLSRGLYLRATDGRLRSPVQKVTMPRSGRLEQLHDDRQAPVQSNLQVTDVRRGISTTVTLQWQTDEHTETIIYYGVGNLRSVKTDHQLIRQHSLVLLGLDADKTYQCQVVSRDLFGNETKSELLTFSTEKSYWDQAADYRSDGSYSTDLDLDWQLYQLQNDYLLEVKADRPISLSLGAENQAVAKNTAERQVVSAGQFSHPVLKSSLDTNITICKECHKGVREEYSHPIRVRARKGMVIPTEYKLLPDGKMSCMTCHDSHASNHEHRLRKSSKAELCRGCHSSY